MKESIARDLLRNEFAIFFWQETSEPPPARPFHHGLSWTYRLRRCQSEVEVEHSNTTAKEATRHTVFYFALISRNETVNWLDACSGSTIFGVHHTSISIMPLASSISWVVYDILPHSHHRRWWFQFQVNLFCWWQKSINQKRLGGGIGETHNKSRSFFYILYWMVLYCIVSRLAFWKSFFFHSLIVVESFLKFSLITFLLEIHFRFI